MSQAQCQLMQFDVSPFGETFLPAVNRRQFDNQNSGKIFAQQFASLSQEETLYIIIGMDSGLLANYVLDKPIPSGSKYIFVELDYLLPLFNMDIPDALQDNVKVITQEQLADTLTSEGNDIFLIKNQYQLHPSLGAKTAYIDDYQLLKNQCRKVLEKAVFNAHVNLNQNVFVHKQLINIADNRYPVSSLNGYFDNKDCILVGGGPSLDLHIEWLKEHQRNLYIFAVSRAASQLQQAGIHVDFVVSVDPQDLSFLVSKEMLELPNSTIFINADHAAPALVGQWHGSQFYSGQKLPWETENNIETAGPTVSNAALWIAGQLKFHRILLLGVDLCWSPSGVSHASGSQEGQLGPDITKIGVWVKTNTGDNAETTVQLAEAITSFGEQVRNLTNCQVINLSGQAAQIPGVSHVPPLQLTVENIDNKFEVLAAIRAKFPNTNSKQALTKLKTQIRSIATKYRFIAKQAKHALSIASKSRANQTELDNIEAELNRHNQTLMQFLKFFGYTHFSHFLTTRDSRDWSKQQIQKLNQAYYKAMANSADALIVLFEESVAHVEARLEELASTPDWIKLQEDWLKYHQSKRLEFMLNQHHHFIDELQNEHPDILKRLREHQAERKQVVYQNDQKQKMTRWNLDVAPTKIHLLYQDHNTLGLEQMIYALDNFQISDEAKQLSARAKSYLYEINGEYQQAFDVLATLPEPWRSEIENKQMVLMAIKTGQWAAAATGLRQLAPHSDEYLPQLAQVLKIRRDYAGALETWLEYLNKHPSDSANWCRLGEMLLQLEQYQDALSIYQQALQADQDNLLARQYVAELSRVLTQ
ncbi:6-hydroxymethylpterin diphosphokinase MptE-like protein [Shewanella sp. GXUN23E]|uniref:motility associated factor glycosyltransferase family protein n=1 Tax=Shewanella sp. GXUN23E TaxID=3422498 RepID=UPI003D7D185C